MASLLQYLTRLFRLQDTTNDQQFPTMSSESLFDFFPPEVKVEIFDYLENKQRQKVRNVCRSWDGLISAVYGATVLFTGTNWRKVPDFNGPLLAVFRDYVYPILDGLNGKDLANRMSSLTIGGFLDCRYMIRIFEECNNLKNLAFDKPLINALSSNYRVNSEANEKLLPILKGLKIDFPTKHNAFYPVWDFVRALFTMLPFFGSRGPKLTSIDIRYHSTSNFPEYANRIYEENWTPDTNCISSLLLALIRYNLDTLSLLHVDERLYKRTARVDFRHSPENAIRPLNEVISGFTESRWNPGFGLNMFSWLNFLSSQNAMKTLVLSGNLSNNWPKILTILENNSECLKTIVLTNFQSQTLGLPGPVWTFDAIGFSQLQRLEKLSLLSNNTEWSPNRYNGEWSSLLNIQLLPTTLKILKISFTISFPETTGFSANAFKSLANLEVFEYSAYPWFRIGESTDVVYLDAGKVHSLLSWLPKLKKLGLRNRRIPDCKIPMSPNTIPAPCIDGIKCLTGINLSRVMLSRKDGCWFFTDQIIEDYAINIEVGSEFRANNFKMI